MAAVVRRDVVPAVARPLKRRVEQHRLDLGAAIPIARVADDADDLNPGAADPDAPADGPGAVEEGPHRRFIHRRRAARLDVRKAIDRPPSSRIPIVSTKPGPTAFIRICRFVPSMLSGPGGQAGGKGFSISVADRTPGRALRRSRTSR